MNARALRSEVSRGKLKGTYSTDADERVLIIIQFSWFLEVLDNSWNQRICGKLRANYMQAQNKEEYTIIIIQLSCLLIYVLSSTASDQLQSQHEYKQQQQ
jgi:hypothetical protein